MIFTVYWFTAKWRGINHSAINRAWKNQLPDDALHIGYLSLKQIKTMID